MAEGSWKRWRAGATGPAAASPAGYPAHPGTQDIVVSRHHGRTEKAEEDGESGARAATGLAEAGRDTGQNTDPTPRQHHNDAAPASRAGH